MSNEFINSLESLQFYLTVPNPCGYLEERFSVNLIADPNAAMDLKLYSYLAKMGFRRSGEHVYKPFCNNCHLCIPLRIPVHEFRPNRSQLRTLKKNSDLRMSVENARFSDEHYALYRSYMQSRHAGGSMDIDDIAAYLNLISSSWSRSELMVFRQQKKVVSICVVDRLEDGISAVYTFFDSSLSTRSPGVFSILSQIQHAMESGLDYVYLGYWNPQSRKMAYKHQYQPNQCFNGQQWLSCDQIKII